MKRKIFYRFFSVILASTLIVFIFGYIAMSLNTEQVMVERLIEETKIIALMLDDSDEFDKFKAYEGNDKFRITIFDLQGNVLLESDTQAVLENHRRFPRLLSQTSLCLCRDFYYCFGL